MGNCYIIPDQISAKSVASGASSFWLSEQCQVDTETFWVTGLFLWDLFDSNVL